MIGASHLQGNKESRNTSNSISNTNNNIIISSHINVDKFIAVTDADSAASKLQRLILVLRVLRLMLDHWVKCWKCGAVLCPNCVIKRRNIYIYILYIYI